MPDIDMDFGDTRRGEVVEYVRRKYGEDHVAQIVTFGTMAARGVIRDVGRALNMSYADCDVIAKLIPNALHITLDEAMKLSRELRERYESEEQVKKLIDTARVCRVTLPHTPPASSLRKTPWWIMCRLRAMMTPLSASIRWSRSRSWDF